jgi:hypothetical protein
MRNNDRCVQLSEARGRRLEEFRHAGPPAIDPHPFTVSSLNFAA